MLAGRPLILPADSAVRIANTGRGGNDVYLTIDGTEHIRLDEHDIVRITRSDHVTRLLSVKNHDFYSVVRKKLSER